MNQTVISPEKMIGILKEKDYERASSFVRMLIDNHPWIKIKAHGTAVGLPSDDDMGRFTWEVVI